MPEPFLSYFREDHFNDCIRMGKSSVLEPSEYGSVREDNLDSNSELSSFKRTSHSAPCCLDIFTNDDGSDSYEETDEDEYEEDSTETNNKDDDNDEPPLRRITSCLVTQERNGKCMCMRHCSCTHHRLRRRVQFADELGLALAKVKFLTEPSYLPPRLPSSVFRRASFSRCKRLNKHCEDELECKPFKPEVSDNRLHCKFSQPEWDERELRNSIETAKVALCSVHCHKSSITGKVLVKNICFRKRVFARVSFDSWSSSKDVEAVFNCCDSSGVSDQFDFSFDVPKNQEIDVQFCVCFADESGESHWDNNNGKNYSIGVTPQGANRPGYTRDQKPNFSQVEFSTFSAWDHFCDRVYY